VSGSKTSSILPLERMDSFLNTWKEKILRRSRIYLMKAESSVAGQLHNSKSFPNIRSIRRSKSPEKSPEETPKEQVND
jgi:hypothetical protein